MRRIAPFILAAVLLCVGSAKVPALINPNFTPVDLVDQAQSIVQLELGPFDGEKTLAVQTIKAIKGKAPNGPLSIDLAGTDKPRVDELRGLFGANKTIGALLFAGDFGEAGADFGGDEGETMAVLHVGAQWFNLANAPAGNWILEPDPQDLQAVWAGGNDMLVRVVDYVLNDPDPWMPTAAEVSWGKLVDAASLTGSVNGVHAVDLAGDGKIGLFILADEGDRIFRFDSAKGAFADLTPSLKLESKSKAAAWADFNDDGRLDLVSWDGTDLSFWRQAESGTFEKESAGDKLSGPCVGLSALGINATGRAGVLVSTTKGLVLLGPGADGSLTGTELQAADIGAGPGAEFGDAHAGLVADFNGDAVADIVQPCAKGALFYRGNLEGGFEAPKPAGQVGTGPGRAAACTGDYDADGLLDILVVGDVGCDLWHNLGGGKFRASAKESGEVAYITKPKAVGCANCDINNDGRQDIAVFYQHMSAQIFFNRGFRCFGYAIDLDLVETGACPDAGRGQMAGTIADVNGDGAQDLVFVLSSGKMQVLFRDTENAPGLCVNVALPAGATGPIPVTAWSEERCLGTWNVLAGDPGAFLGRSVPGPLRLKWQYPGAKPQEKEVIVEEKPVRFILGAKPATR